MKLPKGCPPCAWEALGQAKVCSKEYLKGKDKWSCVLDELKHAEGHATGTFQTRIRGLRKKLGFDDSKQKAYKIIGVIDKLRRVDKHRW